MTDKCWITFDLINAVLLPAHAQTSTLNPVAVPPSGSDVPLNQTISLSISPGIGVAVDIDITCNGAPSVSGSFSLPSDAAGNLTITGNGSGEGCVVGDVLGIAATANGETASSTWTMIA